MSMAAERASHDSSFGPTGLEEPSYRNSPPTEEVSSQCPSTTDIRSLYSFREAPCCVPVQFVLSRKIVRKAFQRLDSVHSPGSPGLIRAAQVTSALRRFDTTFHVQRTDHERASLVSQLDQSISDSSRVRWDNQVLLGAFAVVLNKRERIFFTIDYGDSTTTFSCVVSTTMVFVTLLSITLWMVGTLPSIHCSEKCSGCHFYPHQWMELTDNVCVYLFTVEYLTRLFTVAYVRMELLNPDFLTNLLAAEDNDEQVERQRGVVKTWKFVRSPEAVLDLLVVLPYWIILMSSSDATVNLPVFPFFRVLRVTRVFKLLRLLNSDLGHLSEMKHLLATVCVQAFPAIGLTCVIVLSALLCFSALMHTVERGDWYPVSSLVELQNSTLQNTLELYSGPVDKGYFLRQWPDGHFETSPFSSIPGAAWWTLTTITTVGYGDVYPVTQVGRVVSMCAILYGVLFMGLPIGIIGSQFAAEFSRMMQTSRRRQEAIRERRFAQRRSMRLSTRSMLTTPTAMAPSLSDPQTMVTEGSSVRGGNNSNGSKPGLFGRVLSGVWPRRIRAQTARGLETMGADLTTLPLTPEQEELLRSARDNFEDALQIHGDQIGVNSEQQHKWSEDLLNTQFSAGPALDRLSARVLTVLSEVEQTRPSSSSAPPVIRKAWHELCVVCCLVSEIADGVGPTPSGMQWWPSLERDRPSHEFHTELTTQKEAAGLADDEPDLDVPSERRAVADPDFRLDVPTEDLGRHYEEADTQGVDDARPSLGSRLAMATSTQSPKWAGWSTCVPSPAECSSSTECFSWVYPLASSGRNAPRNSAV